MAQCRKSVMKNQVRDSVEEAFDSCHRAADVITAPLAPIDGLVHGTARGLLNWATDRHPGDEEYRRPKAAGDKTTMKSQEIQTVLNGSLKNNKFIDAKISNKRGTTPVRKQGIQNVKNGSLSGNDYSGAEITNE